MSKLTGGVFALLLLVSNVANAMINDLFISEYVEGSGYNKAIELYNGQLHTINLSEYHLVFYLNGSATPNLTIKLSGFLTPHTTFVVANSLASSEILLVTDQTHDGLRFNGDDVVVLTHKDEIVDSFGQVGILPGDSWGSGDLSSKNRTLRRVSLAAEKDTDIHDNVDFADQWQGYSENSFEGLGTFIRYSVRACTKTDNALWHCAP